MPTANCDTSGLSDMQQCQQFVLLWVVTMVEDRVAEVAREHGWHPPKSLDWDENFKPEHMLFCRKLRFVAIYALFGRLLVVVVECLKPHV